MKLCKIYEKLTTTLQNIKKFMADGVIWETLC